jgi:TIR domain-containing protein
MSTPTVFICYSRDDHRLKGQVVKHLSVLGKQGLLDVWDDQRIGAGQDWFPEIRKAMERARVAILLISHNFLTSDFILREEVPNLLKRREEEGMRIVPVLLSDCDWPAVEWLAAMQIRPDPKVPLNSLSVPKVASELTKIVQEIRKLLASPTPEGPDPASVTKPAESDEQKRSETLNKLKRKLESLSSEKVSDEEDDEPKRLLVYLYKTLRCDFDLEPSGLEERLVAFLMEYRPYTLTGLDKAYSLICDQNLRTAASRIDEIIRLILPFQLPQELWACVLEQHKQGRTVLANAAPGVVFAEAVAARIDGKPIGVSLDGEGIKARNRFGPFPIEHPPLDAPDGTLRSLVKDLFLSAHLETGRTGEAGTLTVPDMMSLLRGSFEWWRNRHERAPYVVVRMPKDSNDRSNYERALAQIKEGVEHVMFLEYCADPAALMVEGGLLGFLHTHLVSERKWKTP